MGKGDKKSKKGKLWRGSYGVSRNKKAMKLRGTRSASVKPAEPKEEVKTPKKKRTTARKKAES